MERDLGISRYGYHKERPSLFKAFTKDKGDLGGGDEFMEILTDLQKKVLAVFFSVRELKQHFYLTGGTALSAFYLKHRLSDDLDLFTHSADLEMAARSFEDAFQIANIPFAKERSSPTFRRYRIEDSLQVDLVRDVDFRAGSPQLIGDFMVDSPLNIAVNKVLAIYGRLDPKDYVDLYFLKTYLNFDILELIKLAQNKDAGLEPFQWAKVAQDAETIVILPRMLVPLTIDELRTFFKGLRSLVIASLKPANLGLTF